MGYALTIGCYLVAFAPSFALFCRFVAPDPLRIILFVLGAFLWMCALLLSSLFWLIFSSFWASNLYLVIAISVIIQEGAKVVYFVILKKAQHGLNKMVKNGGGTVGVSDLHNARHMLALVCGLGMGVISALFLTMNVFAIFSGPGSRGLPEALKSGKRDVNPAGALLPMYYALSGQVISILHVTWTIMVWDTCHRFRQGFLAYIPVIVAVFGHLAVTGLSVLNHLGHQFYVIPCQFAILLGCIVYSHLIIGGTFKSLGKGIGTAFRDWFTLAFLRDLLKKRKNVYEVETLEAEERNVVQQ